MFNTNNIIVEYFYSVLDRKYYIDHICMYYFFKYTKIEKKGL